ncbi:hypothetical protein HMPREF0183_0478 [Brevibacterium mcbrellneri ATCC 49030]|uniref:Uncharacterized protein n=2 Tax=Brevibacterium TaxID=1696 RepID=D4YKL8_9MICO|nr:hypothetical protein HMPREF0183_0478 [Brevibacterium mcbrellneri ATCC 49030]
MYVVYITQTQSRTDAEGKRMSEFTDEIDRKADLLREKINEARENDNEFLAEQLIDELRNIELIAREHDLDTSEIRQVIATETGQLPVINEEP